MIYELPTRSPRKYRGKYPMRVSSWGYSNSSSQQAIAKFLGNSRTVHIELNCGIRFIGDPTDFRRSGKMLGVDFQEVKANWAGPVILMSQAQYDEMMELVKKERGLQ